MSQGRVLVTGASGFVGRNVVPTLLAKGWEVHAMVRDRTAAGGLHRQLQVPDAVAVELRDRDDVFDTVRRAAPTHIIHLAGATMRGGRSRDPADVFADTMLGTVNLIDASEQLDVERFVQLGDALEYGPRPGPVREIDPCRPSTYEGLAKLAATEYAHRSAVEHGTRVVTLRCFSIYGPHDHPERLIPMLVTRALANEPLRLSQPDVTRDFLAVEDLVRLILVALEEPLDQWGAVFNAGSGTATTLAVLVRKVLELTGSTSPTQWGTHQLAPHDHDIPCADITVTERALHWQPEIDLDRGLSCLIDRRTAVV